MNSQWVTYKNFSSDWTKLLKNDGKESAMDEKIKLKRKLLRLNEDERLAYEKGYLDEDGELTDDGKDLLLQLLFENDDELAEEFFEEIRAMYGVEE